MLENQSKNKSKKSIIYLILFIVSISVVGILSFINSKYNDTIKKEFSKILEVNQATYSSIVVENKGLFKFLNPDITINDFKSNVAPIAAKKITVENTSILFTYPTDGTPISRFFMNNISNKFDVKIKLEELTMNNQTIYTLAAYNLLNLAPDSELLKNLIVSLNSGSNVELTLKNTLNDSPSDKSLIYDMNITFPFVESYLNLNLNFDIKISENDFKKLEIKNENVYVNYFNILYSNNDKEFFKNKISIPENVIGNDFVEKFKSLNKGESSEISIIMENKNHLNLVEFSNKVKVNRNMLSTQDVINSNQELIDQNLSFTIN